MLKENNLKIKHIPSEVLLSIEETVSGSFIVFQIMQEMAITTQNFVQHTDKRFCVSIGSSRFESIDKQLHFIGPNIHDSYLPQTMAQDFPNIRELQKGMYVYKRSV